MPARGGRATRCATSGTYLSTAWFAAPCAPRAARSPKKKKAWGPCSEWCPC